MHRTVGLLLLCLPAMAAPASEMGDEVEASVSAFQQAATSDALYAPHPFCSFTDNRWESTWTEQRTTWSCFYDSEGVIQQVVVSTVVEVHEWCDERGQLQREEATTRLLPHPSAPEGTPAICEPGVQVTHTEVLDGARFFQVSEVESPYDQLKGLLAY